MQLLVQHQVLGREQKLLLEVRAVTISTAGNNSFTLSCTGAGGSGSASVTVEGYRNTDGVVVDGYISGAEVCIDEDESWTCDSSESSTTSDNDGKFTIKYANGNLVSIGGTDLDSQTLLDNLLITHKLTGHSDFKAVTPVTSVAAFMTDASLVNAALGIDSSIDVFYSLIRLPIKAMAGLTTTYMRRVTSLRF